LDSMIELDQGQLVHRREKLYFIFAVITSILVYVVLFVSLAGIISAGFFIAFSLFFHTLYMAHIRSNGVQVSPEQFPAVYEKVVELSQKMGLRNIPDVYIVESAGVLNAFATRFFGKNMVILYSQIVELMEDDGDEELSFVIAHELAHLKRRHVTKQLLIFPVMFIPFAGELYSRACEYTCDRFAAYYTGNTEAAKNGLTILAVGKILYKRVNRTAYLEQSSRETGFFVWLSEVLSTHPPLPKRIREIQVFLEGEQPLKTNRKKVFLWTVTALLGTCLVYFGTSYAIEKVMENPAFSTIFAAQEPSSLYMAIYEGDSDSSGHTPLMFATFNNQVEMIRLLSDRGADLNVKESTMGYTALMHAASNGHVEATKLLLELGANPAIVNAENQTAHDLVDSGNLALKKLLK